MDLKCAELLQKQRKLHGLSQEELADKLGVSRQAISKWECGDSSPDTDNLIALSKIYGISIDELLNNTPESRKLDDDGDACANETEEDDREVRGDNAEVKDKLNSDFDDEVDDMDYGKHHKPRPTAKQRLAMGIVSGCTVFVSLIIYLCIGMCLHVWHPTWLVFLSVVLIPSFLGSIIHKDADGFYPVLVSTTYLVVGFLTGLWHPCWVMFITIPIYYIISDAVKKYRKSKLRESSKD